MTMRRLVLAAALAAILASFAAAEAPKGGLKVSAGDIAPPFTLQSSDNQTFSLDGIVKEKPVILVFWSIFCQPCKEEMPVLNALATKYADDASIISVNIDHPRLKGALTAYLKKAGLKFPVLLEQVEGTGDKTVFKTADSFGVKETPTVIGVGPGRKVFLTHVGRMEESDLIAAIEKAPHN
jgi:thiol-disulfide isomerase/thioredoxin